MSETDPREFRNALGQFATGVTVVTTKDEDSNPVGVTASSFNSVSVDPPLVLWSLSKTSGSLDAFETSGGFNVHVLASHQDVLSNQFARPSNNKFAGVDWQSCKNGHPKLPEYAALFRCETEYKYEGGDHIIFVGRVIDYETHNYPVLVFHGGKYADAKAKVKKPEIQIPAVDLDGGQYTDEFLLYLISRAHFQSSYPTRKACAEIGMSESEYFCLSLLSVNNTLPTQQIVTRLEHTGHHPDDEIFARLKRKGWITGDKSAILISEAGRQTFIKLLAQSKALEEQVIKYFTDDEIDGAKAFLKKLIKITGTDIPELLVMLKNKIAVITGAGQGVGQGIALALAAQGAHIVVTGRTLEKCEATAKLVRKRGVKALPLKCNVKSREDLQSIIDATISKFGRLDILVNNAQEVKNGPLLSFTDDQMDANWTSGPLATHRLMVMAYPHLKKNKGCVINMCSSVMRRWDLSNYGLYAAVKAGIEQLTRAAACEWGKDAIRVNAIMPHAKSPALAGWMKANPKEAEYFQNSIPLGYVGECEEDIGAFVALMCSDGSRYLTGQIIGLDGGQAF